MLLLPDLVANQSATFEGWDIAGFSVSCEAFGGDYCDVIPLGDDPPSRQVLVPIGDVSGHGVSASLVMSAARGILRSRATTCSSPGQLLTHLNHLLTPDSVGDCFMTMQLARIDLCTGELSWAGAGHDPIILYDPRADRFHELPSAGIPLGIESDAAYAECRHPGLRQGQILALATDGIWETRDPSGQMFGKDRLRHGIRAAAERSAAEILADVRRDVKAFRGSASRRDDATLLIVKSME